MAFTRSTPLGLTTQQLHVLLLVSEGLSNREIAERLQLSPYTVKEHLSKAMRKLDVHTRVEAAVVADRAGLLEQALEQWPSSDGDS